MNPALQQAVIQVSQNNSSSLSIPPELLFPIIFIILFIFFPILYKLLNKVYKEFR